MSGERRTNARLTAVALDTRHQSGFLTANEGTCAQTNFQIKVEAGAENILTEQTVLLCLIDSDLQSSDCDGVLRTDVHIALLRADRIRRDGHRFNHCVRIAFQHRTIHECTGVTLVRITSNVLHVTHGVLGELPLSAGGEACAASTAKTGSEHLVNDLLRLHGGERLDERLITVHGDIFVNVLGVDHTAVAKDHTGLLLIEVGIGKSLHGGAGGFLLIEQTLHEPALHQVLRHDLGHVLYLHAAVKRTFGIDDNDGTHRAKTKATGLHGLHVGGKICLCKLFVKCLQDVCAVVGVTSRTAANQNMTSVHIFLLRLTWRDNPPRALRPKYAFQRSLSPCPRSNRHR